MRLTITISLLVVSMSALTCPIHFLSIPTDCEESKKLFDSTRAPKGFEVSPKEALETAIKNSYIKECASKLEQVIYIDDRNYYFLNSVELLASKDVKTLAFKVDGYGKQ